MNIIASIYIKNNNTVRVKSGDFRTLKIYDDSPIDSTPRLTRIEHFIGNDNSFDSLILNDKLNDLLTTLFADSPILFKDKINMKLPGGKADLLHLDQAAGWNKYTDFFITS